MSSQIVVGYTTKAGATQEVAQHIADRLQKINFTVDCDALEAISTLDSYTAAILGTPIYIGKWNADLHQFLAQHQTRLAQIPVAIFALGPITPASEEMRASEDQFQQELAQYPWLKPAAQAVFVGKYDPAKLNFFFKILTWLPASPLHKLPASDHRKWTKIDLWTADLPPCLGFQEKTP